MKRSHIIAAGLSLAAFTVTTTSHASGIPTVDAAAFAQLTQQLMTAKSQLETMTSALNNAKQQLAALTQSSGYGDLLNNAKDQLRSALPSSTNDLLNGANSSALKSEIRSIFDEVNAPVNFQEDRQKLAVRALEVEATAKAINKRAYDSMTKRLQNIDALQAQINATKNPKEIAELQARINIEQANIQAEQTRIQLANKQLEAEKSLLQARAERVYSGWFGGSKTETK